MLEGLNKVDWAGLGQGDVPEVLWAVAAADPVTSEENLGGLVGILADQGTRYAATAPAVPFVAELAMVPKIPDRHWLVEALTYAAIGSDTYSLPAGIIEGSFEELARTTNTTGDEERYGRWALDAYRAVEAAVPALAALLEEDDTQLRRAAAHLVAWFPRWAPMSVPLLRERLAAEPDPDTKATMLIALGLLAGARGETEHGPLLVGQLEDGDAVVRWAAAVALARVFPQALPEAAVQELLGWLTDRVDTGRERRLLFPEPEAYILLVLQDQPVLRERAVVTILDRLPVLSAEAAYVAVSNLTFLAFEEGQTVPGTAFADLSLLHQRLFRALAELPAIWRDDEYPIPPGLPLLSHWWPDRESTSPEEMSEQLRAYVAGRLP